nr:catalase-like [Maniola hyperantus]
MFVSVLSIVALVEAMEPKVQRDPATDQIILFKERTKGPVGLLTTSGGAPVPFCETTTLNTKLINNDFFMNSITHVSRERIPERVVHAKGTGAFGYFEVTHDISHICKASFLKKVGKRTPVAVRFSSSRGERGSSDLTRDIRGFAVKFYTEEGNFDIPGFNIPTYFYKDPINFPNIRHAAGRNPATNLLDPKTFWDIITFLPEMLHSILLTFADRGIPASYRKMPGFGVHTYQVANKNGEKYFIRFHFVPDCGIKNLSSEEANNMDPDFLTRDLFRAIGNGNFPSWTLSVQILTIADLKKIGPDLAFDVTRVISLDKYPLHQVGKLVLNRNAKNFHAEIEQLSFCPSNLVPGIYGGADKIYESRRLSYRDSQLYRLGANFNKIPVNCPFQVKTYTYNRDGAPPVGDNEEDIPNYYPNSFHGPVPYMDRNKSELIEITEYKADNFDQIALLYRKELVGDEKIRFIENIVLSLQQIPKRLQLKVIEIFTTIHPDFGKQVSQRLKL